jgi:hypothetical protein
MTRRAVVGYSEPDQGAFQVHFESIKSKAQWTLTLDERHWEGFKKWHAGGGTIQDCMPHLGTHDREAFFSGLTYEEQDSMMSCSTATMWRPNTSKRPLELWIRYPLKEPEEFHHDGLIDYHCRVRFLGTQLSATIDIDGWQLIREVRYSFPNDDCLSLATLDMRKLGFDLNGPPIPLP